MDYTALGKVFGDLDMIAVCLVHVSYSDFSSHSWVCNSPVSLDAPVLNHFLLPKHELPQFLLTQSQILLTLHSS